MKNRFAITNDAANDGPVHIDIEGVIGFEPWWKEDEIVRTKEKMKAQLKALAAIRPDAEIRVEINSYGGDVNHGISIHDLLANHSGKVTTHVYGHTASAATIIAQAGTVRSISANALYLVHQSQTLAAGTADDMDTIARTLRKVNDQIAAVYAKRAGKTPDEMAAVMDRNNGQGEWLTADEAKALGFVDEIVEPFAAAATASPDAFRAAGLPPIPENKLNAKTKKESTMFGLFKNKNEVVDALENLDKAVEAKAVEIRAEFDAKITALETDKAELAKNLADATAARTAAENAMTTAQAEVARLRDEVQAEKDKAARVTATAAPKVGQSTPTAAAGASERFQAAVKAKMAEGMDYEDAAVTVRRENPDLFADMVKEANAGRPATEPRKDVTPDED